MSSYFSDGFDVQHIGNFLSFASRGDRVGLNEMLRKGLSPNVQDYDDRTALHLAASEGHSSIVELLLAYKADVNLHDRWQKTPLADAKLYQHRDICRILEVNGGRETVKDPTMVVRNEDNSPENIDISELQGPVGESEVVKWRGILVVKTVISRHTYHPEKTILSAKENTLLRKLRHPNILQFLGSIVQGEKMILITEHLRNGNLDKVLAKRTRMEPATCLRYALDIARGMNYLHQHKPRPIVHNNLNPGILLLDEGDEVKIGDYWVHMLYEGIQPNKEKCHSSHPQNCDTLFETKKDIHDFGHIFYQLLEGKAITSMNSDYAHIKSVEFEKKFLTSRCPGRIYELIEKCRSKYIQERPSFATVIEILEEVISLMTKANCIC